MNLLSPEEEQILEILAKSESEFFLQLQYMFHNFTYHYHKGVLEPPFSLITKIYTLDRTIADGIENDLFTTKEPHQLCGNIIKHLFSFHIEHVPDFMKCSFFNMVDTLINILEMGNNDSADHEEEEGTCNIVEAKEKTNTTSCLQSIYRCIWTRPRIPQVSMIHTSSHRRENSNRNRIHPTFFIHCNYIHSQLNMLTKTQFSKEVAKDKLGRIMKHFSILAQISESMKESIVESFETMTRSFDFFEGISKSRSEYNWLKRTICLAEYMPISISISIAKPSHRGFPLIYVNRKFEFVTQYNRSEVIGKNCNLLQPDIPRFDEVFQYKTLTNCLANSVPISVIITNHKKDGTPFYNLLSMNPVCDSLGNYLYVIGIQMPILHSDRDINKNVLRIQQVVDVMYIFSNMNNEQGDDFHVGTSYKE